MNWYKISQKLETFEDRNVINKNIRFLNEIINILKKRSKTVFIDAIKAKKEIYEIANSKKMTSYPEIKYLLLNADKVSLDDPWEFSNLCMDAAYEVERKISVLESEREEFSEKTLSNRLKGWVDKYK